MAQDSNPESASSSQRVWRSSCPQCGAELSLRSSAAPLAVCSFCRSTVVRDGEALKKLGQSAELFDDHSPLQLGTAGHHDGRHFTLIGRLQWRSHDAAWNEWVALFDDGRQAWLSEDNGRYVLAFDEDLPSQVSADPELPDQLATWLPEQIQRLGAREWRVASVVTAKVAAAEGELPQASASSLLQGQPHTVVDLRSDLGEVATLSMPKLAAATSSRPIQPTQASWSVGRGVALENLKLVGMRDGAATRGAAVRAAPCPACGAGLRITLETTKSIVCSECRAVVDVSSGVGGELSHFAQGKSQGRFTEPLLPLGASAQLELGGTKRSWQVVGYAVRRVVPEPGDDDEAPWTEYLLYHRGTGFAFLVNAEDGWSWVVPMQGVPKVHGETAVVNGTKYVQRYEYTAETSYVLGEFYWQVQRDQRTRNTDYAAGDRRLNREHAGHEVTWSEGRTLQGRALMTAFGLASPNRPVAADHEPMTSSFSLKHVVMLIILLVIIFMLMRSCQSDRCESTRRAYGSASVEHQQCLQRSGGGSYGRVGGGSWGGSSGGGHK